MGGSNNSEEDIKIFLEPSKFVADIDQKYLSNLIEKAASEFKNRAELAAHLREKYNLKEYNKRNLSNFLYKVSKGKKSIRLSYAIALAEIAKEKNIYDRIKGIRALRCKNLLRTNYPIVLNKSWAFVSECIKVEGVLRNNSAVLENTNTELISKFKDHLKAIGLPKENIKESLHIRVQLPEDSEDQGILIKRKNGKEVKNFHFRTHQLTKGRKKEVVFSDFFEYGKKNKYNILLDSGEIKVSVRVPKYGKIRGKSSYTNKYQAVTASVVIASYNTTFVQILNERFEIPKGRKSIKTRIPSLIKNAGREVLTSVINAVLACESTVTVKSRWIGIASLSRKYLEDLQEILSSFGISSNLNKNTLQIFGLYNFRKMQSNFDFIITKKNKALGSLLNCEEQAPNNKAELFYLKNLFEIDSPSSWDEVISHANRKGRSLRIYKDRLLKKGYIKSDCGRPALYSLPSTGREKLEKSDTSYWSE